MNNRLPVIDLDSHLSDASEELWEEYFPREHRHLQPRVIVDSRGTKRLLVADQLFPKVRGPGCGSPLGIAAAAAVFTIEERLEYITRMNIDRAFLTPGFVGLGALTSTDRDARLALAEAHNRLVCDVALADKVFEPVPVMSVDDSHWSVSELNRCRESATVRAVVTRPTTYEARPFRDAAENPLLNYLAELNTALYLHTTTGYHQVSPVADLFDDYIFTHAFSHPIEQMVALADLLASGLMAKGLRVVVLEAGCGWLPWFVDRLETHFSDTGGRHIDLSAREQATDALLVGVYPDDPGIPLVADTLDLDMVAFMSDFPHWDAATEENIAGLIQSYGEESARKILYENAARVLLQDGVESVRTAEGRGARKQLNAS